MCKLIDFVCFYRWRPNLDSVSDSRPFKGSGSFPWTQNQRPGRSETFFLLNIDVHLVLCFRREEPAGVEASVASFRKGHFLSLTSLTASEVSVVFGLGIFVLSVAFIYFFIYCVNIRLYSFCFVFCFFDRKLVMGRQVFCDN